MARLPTLKTKLQVLQENQTKPRSIAPKAIKQVGGSWRTGKTTAERGYGSKWQTYRKRFLAENPLCCYCLEQGRVTAAKVVDHIAPHRGDQRLFWDVSNHQSLCSPCHSSIKQQEENGNTSPYAYVFMPDWLEPIPKLTIVFGPPGSGKSTWVNNEATEKDIVLDLDMLISDISGKPMYKGNKQDFALAVRKRNELLLEMARNNQSGYLILTGMKVTQRNWWVRKLMPIKVHTMDTAISECINRITKDERRSMSVKQQQILSLRNWEAGGR